MIKLITKTSYNFAKVGFIGLGNMGFPMAINLSKKGHQVYAFDVDKSKEKQTSQHNITFRQEVKQLAKDANIFVTMLPNSEHSISVCQGDQGLFKNVEKNSLIIDCSTIAPSVAINLTKKAEEHNLIYVDAPVSGGVTGAAAGTLTIMVGSETQQIFDRTKPVLQCMSKKVFNCGKSGAGQIAKLCNNMALAIEMIGASEALALGKKLGMDDKILTKVLSASTSNCWSIQTYNPVPGVLPNVPASREYENGFACELMLKDVNLAMQAAKDVNCQTVLGQKSKDIYEDLVKRGLGRKDFGVIYDLIINNKL